jgi:hypothetical protein
MYQKCRVPHISLVFREMWDSTDLDRSLFLSDRAYLRNENSTWTAVESHISRKTSEIWGTRAHSESVAVETRIRDMGRCSTHGSWSMYQKCKQLEMVTQLHALALGRATFPYRQFRSIINSL